MIHGKSAGGILPRRQVVKDDQSVYSHSPRSGDAIVVTLDTSGLTTPMTGFSPPQKLNKSLLDSNPYQPLLGQRPERISWQIGPGIGISVKILSIFCE